MHLGAEDESMNRSLESARSARRIVLRGLAVFGKASPIRFQTFIWGCAPRLLVPFFATAIRDLALVALPPQIDAALGATQTSRASPTLKLAEVCLKRTEFEAPHFGGQSLYAASR